MMVVTTFEMSVNFYDTTRGSIPESCRHHSRRHENQEYRSSFCSYTGVSCNVDAAAALVPGRDTGTPWIRGKVDRRTGQARWRRE
jgi:hypothetical protein